MSGVGVSGGYGPPTLVGNALAAYGEYPPGPSQWPAGTAWPVRTGNGLYANDLNQQLSLPVGFLANRPMFSGIQQTAQSIPSGGSVPYTPVTMDTPVVDPWRFQANPADDSQITIPSACDGVYLVQGLVPFNSTGTGSAYQAFLVLNGALAAGGEGAQANGVHTTVAAFDLLALAQGDACQLNAFQNSGAAVSTYITASGEVISPALSARWVGALPYALNSSGTAVPVPATQLTLPAQKTWTDPLTIGYTDLNGNVIGAVQYLAYPPMVRAVATATTSLPSGAATHITGLAVNQSVVTAGSGTTWTFDNFGAFSASTWTCRVAGLYLTGGSVDFAGQSGAFQGQASISVTSAGVTTNYAGAKMYGTHPVSSVIQQIRLNVGDTVQILGAHNFGSTINTNTPSFAGSRFFSVWMSS